MVGLLGPRESHGAAPRPVTELSTPPTEPRVPASAPREPLSRASRGALWAGLGYAGTQGVRLASNLLLTRLLFEEAFGIMALVTVFMQGLQLFSDVGVGPNIVQSERGDDPRFLNTAWTMQVVRGFLLWVVSCAVAVPFAAFYDEPLLASIVPVSGFTAFLAGLNSTKLYTELRRVALKRFVLVDLASQIASMLAMVSWALVDRSVWALVSGGLVGGVVKTLLTHLALPGPRNRLAWDPTAVRAIFRFGGWIFFSTILTFLDRNAHTLIFAKVITTAQLGVYQIGVMVATLPTLALGHLTHNVLFPLYSRVIQAGGDVGPVFRRARLSVLIVAGWVLSGFMAGGQTAIDLLWDERYSDAGWALRLLSAGAWFSLMEVTNGSAFLARGKANMLVISNTTKLLTTLFLIPCGFVLGGFQGAVCAYAGTELFKYAVSAETIARVGLSSWRRDLAVSAHVLAAALLGSFTGELVRSTSGSVILSAVAVFASVTLAWTPLALGWKRHLAREGTSFFGD